MKVTIKTPLVLFANQEAGDDTDAFYEATEHGRTLEAVQPISEVILNSDGYLEATLTLPVGEEPLLAPIAQAIVAKYRALVPDWEVHEAAREERRLELENGVRIN